MPPVKKTPSRSAVRRNLKSDAHTPSVNGMSPGGDASNIVMTPGWTTGRGDLFKTPNTPSPNRRITRSRRSIVSMTGSPLLGVKKPVFKKPQTRKLQAPKRKPKDVSPIMTRGRRRTSVYVSKTIKQDQSVAVGFELNPSPQLKKSSKREPVSKTQLKSKVLRRRSPARSLASREGKSSSGKSLKSTEVVPNLLKNQSPEQDGTPAMAPKQTDAPVLAKSTLSVANQSSDGTPIKAPRQTVIPVQTKSTHSVIKQVSASLRESGHKVEKAKIMDNLKIPSPDFTTPVVKQSDKRNDLEESQTEPKVKSIPKIRVQPSTPLKPSTPLVVKSQATPKVGIKSPIVSSVKESANKSAKKAKIVKRLPSKAARVLGEVTMSSLAKQSDDGHIPPLKSAITSPLTSSTPANKIRKRQADLNMKPVSVTRQSKRLRSDLDLTNDEIVPAQVEMDVLNKSDEEVSMEQEESDKGWLGWCTIL